MSMPLPAERLSSSPSEGLVLRSPELCVGRSPGMVELASLPSP